MNQDLRSPPSRHAASRRARPDARAWRRDLLAGGTEGNEQLTVLSGLLLIVLLAALGVTILRVGQLRWLHIFLGCVLVGPLTLKVASVGYRLSRYYTSDPAYRRKGPPSITLRLLAPLLVFFTLAVFATGATMLLLGPHSRGSVLILHKVSFIGWITVAALHVVAHLPDVVRFLRGALASRREPLGAHTVAGRSARLPGHTGRSVALAGALLGGLVIAIALSGQISTFAHAVITH
jgi:hypothetical protein